MGKNSVRPKSFSQKLRNFFIFCVLAVGTPNGGKSQNTGFLGPFGLGQRLALGEIPGEKNGKTRFPGPRGTFGGEIPSAPKVSPKSCAMFLHFLRFRRPDPQGQEIAKYWSVGPFWPRADPWHLEKFRTENRKTQFPVARGTFGEKNPSAPKVSSQNFANFDQFAFWSTGPPGREIAKYWFSGPFGLGQPLALRGIPGGKQKNENSQIETEKR